MKKRICILYGYAEGPLSATAFKQHFKQLGYGFTSDPAHADIIFIHSGGILFAPTPKESQQLIVYMPAYRHGKGTAFKKFFLMTLRDTGALLKAGKIWEYVKLYALHYFYLVAKLPYNIAMIHRYFSSQGVRKLLCASNVLVITNAKDIWYDPVLASSVNCHIAPLPALHDGCWLSPQTIPIPPINTDKHSTRPSDRHI